MSVILHVVDAFTRTIGQGNRAGVVLDAEGLSDAQMQQIAAFAGYSETAFVLPAQGPGHDLQVRYFTPRMEVPICGHATVATHFLRVQLQGLQPCTQHVLTGAGVLPIEIIGTGDTAHVKMTQGVPEFGLILDGKQKAQVLAGLGIGATDLADMPIQVVSTGHSKVMVPLTSCNLLNGLAPDMALLADLSRQIDCNGFFPFVVDNGVQFCTRGRMFAPVIGINEDPVTGNANGPAGAYLHHYGVIGLTDTVTYQGHQGQTMGKPGTVFVTLNHQQTGAVQVQIGGDAVYAGSREFDG